MAKKELEAREKLKLTNIAKDWLGTEHSEGNIQSLVNLILSFIAPREKRIAELEAQIEIMKSCVNCRYCINEKCPWQPKGCGMKHWELKEIKENGR